MKAGATFDAKRATDRESSRNSSAPPHVPNTQPRLVVFGEEPRNPVPGKLEELRMTSKQDILSGKHDTYVPVPVTEQEDAMKLMQSLSIMEDTKILIYDDKRDSKFAGPNGVTRVNLGQLREVYLKLDNDPLSKTGPEDDDSQHDEGGTDDPSE
jgi:hypothetical protein